MPPPKSPNNNDHNMTFGAQKKDVDSSSMIKQGNEVFSGLIMRKCGWLFYEPVLLVLKDNKFMAYYDPATSKIKVFFVLRLINKEVRGKLLLQMKSNVKY